MFVGEALGNPHHDRRLMRGQVGERLTEVIVVRPAKLVLNDDRNPVL